jgi:phosphoenolpyruvate carboxykinase (GTP)
MASTMGSETTAAAAGEVGKIRRDPMAMLPFLGYHMSDYFKHWLKFGRRISNPPRMFFVNWFRKNADGKFIWPGFGENMRVLKWIIDRVHGGAYAIESPLGWKPRYEDLIWEGLESFSQKEFNEIMSVDREAWKKEVLSHDEMFVGQLYDKLPKEFIYMRELMLCSLWLSPEHWGLKPEDNPT